MKTNEVRVNMDLPLEDLKKFQDTLEKVEAQLYDAAGDIGDLVDLIGPIIAEGNVDNTDAWIKKPSKEIETGCSDCKMPCKNNKTDDTSSPGEPLAIDLLKAVFQCLAEACEEEI